MIRTAGSAMWATLTTAASPSASAPLVTGAGRPGGEDLGIPGLGPAHLIARSRAAAVFRARHLPSSQDVAVKVPVGGGGAALAHERRVLQEVGGHPNIVRLVASGSNPAGRSYLATEYLPLGTVDHGLGRRRWPWAAAVVIGLGLAQALERMHRAGIVHGDVKPENVLLATPETPQLADFGSSRRLDQPRPERPRWSFSIPYAAPELLNGEAPSVATDVYGLACTIASMLCGHPCFVPDDPAGAPLSMLGLMARICSSPPADLRDRGVPEGVCTVLERSMAKDPGQRAASPAQFGHELDAAAALAAGPDSARYC